MKDKYRMYAGVLTYNNCMKDDDPRRLDIVNGNAAAGNSANALAMLQRPIYR